MSGGAGGNRMSLEDARSVLGNRVAFTAHGDQWVTGRLVGIAETPQLLVEHEDGSKGHYTLSTVIGWAAALENLCCWEPCTNHAVTWRKNEGQRMIAVCAEHCDHEWGWVAGLRAMVCTKCREPGDPETGDVFRYVR